MVMSTELAPIFLLDSRERWQPQAVESLLDVGATLNGRPVDLANLPAAGGRMNLPPDMRMPEGHRRVGYHRRVRAEGGVWDQFWLWWLYNPKMYAGTGAHEGDWEFVQVASFGDTPVLVTCSQHQSGEGREWWDVERRDGRPVVYVAAHSHAHYFEPVRTTVDYADGEGIELAEIEWRPFGPWAMWPGRWGNSTGEGKSPQSPGQQVARWRTPHRYHSRSR
jgi:hypothetical protein